MLDYSYDINSEIFPVSGECSFWLRGERCGATTCHECGADAAAALVANAAASITGVVVAARNLAAEGGSDPFDVSADIFAAWQRRFPGPRSAVGPWLDGLWDAATSQPAPASYLRGEEIYYAIGRIAFLAWRNAREENRRV